MNRPLRIVHVITGLNTGGAETALCRLLQSLRSPAFEHAVISLLPPGTLSERVAELATLHHMGMHRGRMTPVDLLRLRGRIGEVQPDVIQGWMYHANLIVTLASGGMHIPVVWGIRHSLHAMNQETRKTRWVVRTGAIFSRLPEAIVYNSVMSRRQHAKSGYFDGRAQVIANGFDTGLLAPDMKARRRMRHELGISVRALAIGLVARVHPVKGHADFLHAARIFKDAHRNVVFVLVGDGTGSGDRPLARLVEQLDLGSDVRLCGRRTDISAVNNALDISCSASHGEAFPNAITEAMACGTPCVATDVGDSRDIIGDTGIVAPPKDPQALAAGWAELAALGAEGRKALGLRARQRVVENFSLEKNAQAYASLYRRLAAER